MVVDTKYIGYKMHQCYECNQEKAAPEFPKRYIRVDGTGLCRVCTAKRRRIRKAQKRQQETDWSSRKYTPDMLGYDPITPAQAKRNEVRHIRV